MTRKLISTDDGLYLMAENLIVYYLVKENVLALFVFSAS